MSTAAPLLRAVLFDWDGTLSDSAEASFRCYARLFPEYGIPFARHDFQRTYSPDWYRTYTQLACRANAGKRPTRAGSSTTR